MSFEDPKPKKEKEKNIEDQLIDALRSEGLEGETSKKLLQEWWSKRESLTEDERWTSDIRRADVLFAAGLLQEARDQYETIAQEAYEAQKDDVVQACDEKIQEITKNIDHE